ncbi:MAG: hypothetical protein AAGD13_11390 [Pseudomonadota bacterium]
MIRALTACLAAIVLSLAGCTTEQAETDRGFRSDTIAATADITAIDTSTREIILTTEDGRRIGVAAGPEVRNFDQLEVGDAVRITYTEAVAVEMASEADQGEPTKTVAGGRAVEGAKPGLTVGALSEQVVEFIVFDENSNLVAYVDARGTTQTAVVRPEMQDFAKARKQGDLVKVTIERALAVSIVPVS